MAAHGRYAVTATRAIEEGVNTGLRIVDAPAGLSSIHQPEGAAVIWRRGPVPRFQKWIDDLDPSCLPSGRLILRPDDVHEAALQTCEVSGTPTSEEREILVDDIATLADGFARITHAPYLRLRFDVVTSNACRRFHIDAVTARLVCTYRGPGTQYGISTDGAEPQRIFTVPTGAPIVLRGTRWPEKPKSGLLHRSPPIEGTGQTRLVVVLDAAVHAGR